MKLYLPENHPKTLICMGNLAAIYEDSDEVELAIPLYEESLELEKATLGEDHPAHRSNTWNNLAVSYWTAKQFGKSVPLFRKLIRERDGHVWA